MSGPLLLQCAALIHRFGVSLCFWTAQLRGQSFPGSLWFDRRHTYFYELECAASPLILLCLSVSQRIQA